ncbi:glycosyltransferase family 2 protein [Antarcticibacterium arcticum]|uniref:glycosyltransferase family 2 protein n=1 Tax=Antarcticibacterium arcticum TaxID=2585771 RepID=UPI00143D6B48|nr:glycosyltransferase family A protein [Antarcticibacterium arcticum]
MKDSKMTVIMPVYNRGNIVKKSVDSVLDQTFKNFELLIIDDCSTDDTWEVITSFKDPRIKSYKLAKNSGAAAARNYGIDKSTSNYICFLDSDDTLERDFLKTSLDVLRDTPPRVGFMWTGRNIITGDDHQPQSWRPSGVSSYQIFLKHIRIGTGAGITIKKQVFDKCGNFNENLPAAEDTEFFFRISQQFDFTYTDRCLINIYKSGSSRLSRSYKSIAIAYNSFLKDHFGEIDKDPELKRIYYYKMMWLNFHIPDPDRAKEYYNKIPSDSILDSVKIQFIYGIYKFLPLEYASYIHGKFSS